MAKGTIFFRGPAPLLPGEEQQTAAARSALVEAMRPIAASCGGIPAQNALISLWLDMSLSVLGVAATQEALRLLRRDVPKFAAALRAAKAEPEGSA